MTRATLWIAARELTARLRDRSALIVGVVAPIGLALIISFATGGEGAPFRAVAGLVDEDGGEIAAVFATDVLGSDGVAEVFDVRTLSSREEALAALDQGTIDVAIVLAPDLATITILRVARAGIAGEVAASIAANFAAQLAGVSQAVGLTVMTGLLGREAFGDDGPSFGAFSGSDFGDVDLAALDVEAMAEEVAEAELPFALEDASAGESGLASAAYYGPGMAMLFVFFLLGAAPRSLLAEARDGTLARLRAAPIPVLAIVLGKGLATAALGLLAMLIVWAVTAAVFGQGWGDPVGVLALLVSFVLAALAITTLVSVYARSASQADGYVSIVAFVLAMLGGNFLFLGDLPEALQTVARWTPNGWAMQGFVTLTADGGGVTTIVGPVVAILGFAVAGFLVALPGLRRWTAA
jgi:ABC-2 type transport system permease protein